MVKQDIKNRVIYVYPKRLQAEKWREIADKQGMTLSKFVIEHVENSLRQEEDSSYEPRTVLIKRIRDLEEDLGEARKEARMMRIVAEKLEKENRRLRTAPFVEEGSKALGSTRKSWSTSSWLAGGSPRTTSLLNSA